MAYIDVDEFAEVICKSSAIDEHSANAVIFMLRNQPTADVVKVVKCEECVYRKECNREIYVEGSYSSVNSCSSGERRTDDAL